MDGRLDTRVTIHLTSRNWKEFKKRKANRDLEFSLSRVVNRYLDQIFFGDIASSVEIEIETVKKKLKDIAEQKDLLNDRLGELQKIYDEKEQKQKQEIKLFQRFHTNVSRRIDSMDKMNIAPDYTAIASVWGRDFFPNTEVNVPLVKEIFNRCKCNSFDFDFFKEIRKGNNGFKKS